VKNSQNTITDFRNILGLKFSEIPQNAAPTSAPIVQHPTLADTPAYTVSVLAPAPSPLPASSANTPAATPRSEPISTTRTLTPSEVTSIFLKSLLTSAEDFLGKKVEAAVLTVPTAFSQVQREALEKAAVDAGVPVVQLLDEAGAVASLTTSPVWTGEEDAELAEDRTQLVIDVGSTSTSLHLLSIRQGLAYILATNNLPGTGANAIDDKVIKHFAADFTKKTKIPLQVAPANGVADQRAEARLRLAIEHTKRTVSASPGAATCSVESLKDGFDYTGSINRMRFDMVAAPVYAAISEGVVALLSTAGVDASEVDEVVYVGGTAALPGLGERIATAVGFDEDIKSKDVFAGGVGDPTSILARGAAIQAALLSKLSKSDEEGKEVREAILSGKLSAVKATTRTVGVLFPNDREQDVQLGGVFVPVVQKETALPARRILEFNVGVGEAGVVSVEFWEVKEGIRVEKVKIPRDPEDEDEEDEEEEEEEIKHKIISKEVLLGLLSLPVKKAVGGQTKVRVQVIVGIEGEMDAQLEEVGGEVVRLHLPAP